MRLLAAGIFVVFLAFPGMVRAGEFTFYVGEVYPFVMLSESGGVYGAAVDVVKEIMRGVGKPVEAGDMQSISWARAQDTVRTTPDHGLFCMARTPQREARYDWVGPIASLNLGLLAKKTSNIVIRQPSDVRRYSVGVVRDSAPQHLLNDFYGIKSPALELLKGIDTQYRMLAEGRVDLITQSDISAPEELRRVGENPDDYEMVHVIKHVDLYVAFNTATDDRLIERMQAVLNAMKEGGAGKSRLERIMHGYRVDSPISIKE